MKLKDLPRFSNTAALKTRAGAAASAASGAMAALPGALTGALAGKRLNRRTRSAIGIDVGARAIKAVQFGRERFGSVAWRVVAAAEMPRDEVAGAAVPGQVPAGQPPQSAHFLTPAEVRRLVGTLDRKGFAGADIVLAMPNDKVFSSMLELPPRSSQAPIEQIARMEMARAHRFPLDGFEMGCWDLPAAARATKQTPVMAVACTHADAAAVLDPFEGEGLNVAGLDVKAAAHARACAPLTGGDSSGIVGIVDLGWSAATLSLMHEGVTVYGRTLGDSGIRKLYHTLATRLGLEIDVIDYLLADSGLAGTEAVACAIDAPASAPRKTKVAADAAGLVAAHFEAAINELQVSIAYAQRQYPDTPLSRLLVVGGGGCIRGVTEHLRRALQMDIRSAAPADVASCAPDLSELCGSPSLMAALGLALFDGTIVTL